MKQQTLEQIFTKSNKKTKNNKNQKSQIEKIDKIDNEHHMNMHREKHDMGNSSLSKKLQKIATEQKKMPKTKLIKKKQHIATVINKRITDLQKLPKQRPQSNIQSDRKKQSTGKNYTQKDLIEKQDKQKQIAHPKKTPIKKSKKTQLPIQKPTKTLQQLQQQRLNSKNQRELRKQKRQQKNKQKSQKSQNQVDLQEKSHLKSVHINVDQKNNNNEHLDSTEKNPGEIIEINAQQEKPVQIKKLGRGKWIRKNKKVQPEIFQNIKQKSKEKEQQVSQKSSQKKNFSINISKNQIISNQRSSRSRSNTLRVQTQEKKSTQNKISSVKISNQIQNFQQSDKIKQQRYEYVHKKLQQQSTPNQLNKQQLKSKQFMLNKSVDNRIVDKTIQNEITVKKSRKKANNNQTSLSIGLLSSQINQIKDSQNNMNSHNGQLNHQFDSKKIEQKRQPNPPPKKKKLIKKPLTPINIKSTLTASILENYQKLSTQAQLSDNIYTAKPLIFNKFTEPQQYQQLIKEIKSFEKNK